MLTLKIISQSETTLAIDFGESAGLVYNNVYNEGDQIELSSDTYPVYIAYMLDDALGQAFGYLTGPLLYTIPFGGAKVAHSPKSFAGSSHYLFARVAEDFEIRQYRNLALNVYDLHENMNLYPHASANIETRGEAIFAARNAIDGYRENRSHGVWPYTSWGIGKRADAELHIDFGRPVDIDRIILVTRADFPHDAWWTQVTLGFFDGSTLDWSLQKSTQPHEITFETKRVTALSFKNLIKADDPSPFPALTQIEVYGQEAE